MDLPLHEEINNKKNKQETNMSRYSDEERVIVLRNDSGGRDIFDQFVAELVKKALDKKDHKHDDEEHGFNKRKRIKPMTHSAVACWTILLMAASPWIGLKVLQMYSSLLGDYAAVLQHFVK